MNIRLTKARHADRSHTLTCIREDGTATGQASSGYFAMHDLTHYAVETTLNLTDGFYGLLSQGWEISSFEEREPGSFKLKRLPLEAKWAEMLAGSYDLERAMGPIPDEDRLLQFQDACQERGLFEPDVSVELLGKIRILRNELWDQWNALEPGETLELPFPRLPASVVTDAGK